MTAESHERPAASSITMSHLKRYVAHVPAVLYEQALKLVFQAYGETERAQLVDHFLPTLLTACGEHECVADGGLCLPSTRLAAGHGEQARTPAGSGTESLGEAMQAAMSWVPGHARQGPATRPSMLLLGAFAQHRILGAALLQFLAGRAAMLFPPQLVDPADETAADMLLQAALTAARDHGAKLVQCLLSPAEAVSLARLGRHGIHKLAELAYLYCEAEHFPTAPPPGPLVFEPYRACERQRLMALVEATYRGTLDCPALNGIRTADEVLAGYEFACGEELSLWYVVVYEGREAGCLLVASYGVGQACELTYMGLAPEYRGQGLGRQMVLHALWLARQSGGARMVAAVDLANAPALHVYLAAGFRAWDRRLACACILA